MTEAMEAILTHEGKAKGILDSLNSCPDITEPRATDTLIVLNDFYPPSFLIVHLLFPFFSLLFTLLKYLSVLKLR